MWTDSGFYGFEVVGFSVWTCISNFLEFWSFRVSVWTDSRFQGFGSVLRRKNVEAGTCCQLFLGFEGLKFWDKDLYYNGKHLSSGFGCFWNSVAFFPLAWVVCGNFDDVFVLRRVACCIEFFFSPCFVSVGFRRFWVFLFTCLFLWSPKEIRFGVLEVMLAMEVLFVVWFSIVLRFFSSVSFCGNL